MRVRSRDRSRRRRPQDVRCVHRRGARVGRAAEEDAPTARQNSVRQEARALYREGLRDHDAPATSRHVPDVLRRREEARVRRSRRLHVGVRARARTDRARYPNVRLVYRQSEHPEGRKRERLIHVPQGGDRYDTPANSSSSVPSAEPLDARE